MMTDPVADMLTRIRNGQSAKHAVVHSPYSNLRKGILEVLANEGYIRGYSVEKLPKNKARLIIELKYIENSKAVIKKIVKISKPGCRVYGDIKTLPRYYNGLGTIILSTSKGVMSDHDARMQNVGGELLCKVF